MKTVQPRKTKRNFFIRLRPVIRWVIKLRSSPKSIAGGLGLGTFIAFTPTIGIQLILAVIAATFLGLNRPAAMIPVWITNPITVAPIYTFNYWLGCQLWSGPPLSEVTGLFLNIGKTMARLELWDIQEQLLAVLHMGRDVLIPLFLGSVIIGAISGAVVYIFSLNLLSIFFNRRIKKRLLNNRKNR